MNNDRDNNYITQREQEINKYIESLTVEELKFELKRRIMEEDERQEYELFENSL